MDQPFASIPGSGSAWKAIRKDDFAREVCSRAGANDGGRPWLVAIDGRGGSGKTHLSQQLTSCVTSSAVVHTDDIAWHHSFFDWDDLARESLLEPLCEGRDVRFRPPGWDSHGRAGHIEVPSDLDLVIVEGTGSGRRSLAPLLDLVVWVECAPEECRLRCIGRDGGTPEAVRFFEEWDVQEREFLSRDRPWERAGLIVGTSSPLVQALRDEVVLWTGTSGHR